MKLPIPNLDETEYHARGRFEDVDPGPHRLAGHTFEDCVFTSCRFDDRPQAGGAFISSEFRKCELVLTKLAGVTLNGVLFSECKWIGSLTNVSTFSEPHQSTATSPSTASSSRWARACCGASEKSLDSRPHPGI